MAEACCKNAIETTMEIYIMRSLEYSAISDYYKDDITDRSGVKLMNHIDEGIEILNQLGATPAAIAAYCLHPIFQNDADLTKNVAAIKLFDPYVIMLTMEYRRTANSYLCRPGTDDFTLDDICRVVGLLLPEVKDMLIADKKQNSKDFMLYHYGVHKRTTQLHQYFKNWCNLLNC